VGAFPCAPSYAGLHCTGNPAIPVGFDPSKEFVPIDTIAYRVCKDVGRRSRKTFGEERGMDESGKLIFPLE